MGQVNDTIENILPEIGEISSTNADAEIKIAVLEFSSGIEWMYPEPISAEDFTWQNLEAGGLTSMGEAFKELNTKLSQTTGFMLPPSSCSPTASQPRNTSMHWRN